MDARATPFTTEAGVELWVLPLFVGESSPLGPPHIRAHEPGVQIFHREPNADGTPREQITYGLSSLESYVATLSPGGIRASVNYTWADLDGLLAIAKRRFEGGLVFAAGPRGRLSSLAERLA